MKRRQQRQQFLLAFQFPRTQAFHKPSKNVYAVIQTGKNKLVVKEKKALKEFKFQNNMYFTSWLPKGTRGLQLKSYDSVS